MQTFLNGLVTARFFHTTRTRVDGEAANLGRMDRRSASCIKISQGDIGHFVAGVEISKQTLRHGLRIPVGVYRFE